MPRWEKNLLSTLLAGIFLAACQTTGSAPSTAVSVGEASSGTSNSAVASGSNSPSPAGTDESGFLQPLPIRPIPADIDAGERPASDTDEAGLWLQLDRAEAELKTSGHRIRDEALQAYLDELVCRIAGEFCPDIRVYIVRAPAFNATMSPNGMMQVWTGLLLRTRSEAQLSAVLGHEIAHYLRRHTLKRWRNVRSKTNGLVFVQLATSAAGIGLVGSIAAYGVLGDIQAFGRDHEREADFMGQNLMVGAGYDPGAASTVWDQLIEEKARLEEIDPERDGPTSLFLASHPTEEERAENLSKRANAFAPPDPEWFKGQERFQEIMKTWRPVFLRDEIEKGDPDKAQALIETMLEYAPNDGELHFFEGEVHRARGGDGDREKALKSYNTARHLGFDDPTLYRSLGLIHVKLGENRKAAAALRTYLDREPQATDRAIIQHMLERVSASS